MIVFHEWRAAYFAIPKVANSSLKAYAARVLADQVADLHCPGMPPIHVFRNGPGRRALRERSILFASSEQRRLSRYWKFAFVRNPWDRLVSLFAEKVASGKKEPQQLRKLFGEGVHSGTSFAEFVDLVCRRPDAQSNRHFRSQHSFICDRRGRIRMDFVGSFEHLDEDFASVAAHCGFLESIELPHLLKSARSDYRDYYTPELVEKVAERYATDIRLLGYEFETARPGRRPARGAA